MIEGVIHTPLSVFPGEKGSVLRAMRKDEDGYNGFGEAYFSTVEQNFVKAWKRHRRMTLNIIVPVGKIGFVIYDSRANSSSFGRKISVILSRENYYRLTIPPMVWAGFTGLSNGLSLLLNIADLRHDPNEVDHKDINEIEYNWDNLI